MKTTSSDILNSTAILDAVRSRESEILFGFHDKSSPVYDVVDRFGAQRDPQNPRIVDLLPLPLIMSR